MAGGESENRENGKLVAEYISHRENQRNRRAGERNQLARKYRQPQNQHAAQRK